MGTHSFIAHLSGRFVPCSRHEAATHHTGSSTSSHAFAPLTAPSGMQPAPIHPPPVRTESLRGSSYESLTRVHAINHSIASV